MNFSRPRRNHAAPPERSASESSLAVESDTHSASASTSPVPDFVNATLVCETDRPVRNDHASRTFRPVMSAPFGPVDPVLGTTMCVEIVPSMPSTQKLEETEARAFLARTTPSVTLRSPVYMVGRFMDIPLFADARESFTNNLDTRIMPPQNALAYLSEVVRRAYPLIHKNRIDISGGVAEGYHPTVWGEHMDHARKVTVRLRWTESRTIFRDEARTMDNGDVYTERVVKDMFMGMPIVMLIFLHEIAHRVHRGHGRRYLQFFNALVNDAMHSPSPLNPSESILDLTQTTPGERFIVEQLRTEFTRS